MKGEPEAIRQKRLHHLGRSVARSALRDLAVDLEALLRHLAWYALTRYAMRITSAND